MIKLNEDDTTSSSRIFIKVYCPYLAKLFKGSVSIARDAFFYGGFRRHFFRGFGFNSKETSRKFVYEGTTAGGGGGVIVSQLMTHTSYVI